MHPWVPRDGARFSLLTLSTSRSRGEIFILCGQILPCPYLRYFTPCLCSLGVSHITFSSLRFLPSHFPGLLPACKIANFGPQCPSLLHELMLGTSASEDPPPLQLLKPPRVLCVVAQLRPLPCLSLKSSIGWCFVTIFTLGVHNKIRLLILK